MKIVTVIGARPQFIKEAVFQKELRKNNIEEVLVHTGQHYDKSMSEDIFKNLNIESPRYFLNIHSSSGNESTANMMIELEKVFERKSRLYCMFWRHKLHTCCSACSFKDENETYSYRSWIKAASKRYARRD